MELIEKQLYGLVAVVATGVIVSGVSLGVQLRNASQPTTANTTITNNGNTSSVNIPLSVVKGTAEEVLYFPKLAKVKEIYVGEGKYIGKNGNIAKLEISNGSSKEELLITAPIKGNVYDIAFTAGEYVHADNVVAMKIVDQESYVIVAAVSQKQIKSIAPGQSVNFTIPAISETGSAAGKVGSVTGTPRIQNSGDITYDVLIRPDQALPEGVKSGMSVNVQW